MARTRRLSQLEQDVAARLRLPPGDLVVALSGGGDSAALAHLCVIHEREVRALHVDHGLPGSPQMRKAATTISEQLGIDIHVTEVTIQPGASPEGRARQARYEAFGDFTGPGDALLTGHTIDDSVETILFNFIRGAGLRGVSGIPYHRPPNVFRPMLAISRSETREIAGLSGLAFAEDSMNEDTSLTRNLLRMEVLPSLRRLNSRLDDAIARLGRSAASDSDFLDLLASGSGLTERDGQVSVPIGSLVAMGRPLADRAVMDALSRSGVDPTMSRVKSAWDVALGETDSWEVGDGVTVRRAGPLLLFSRPVPHAAPAGEEPLAPGTTTWGRLEFEVVEHESVCRVVPLSKWAAVFPRDVALTVTSDGVVAADGAAAWVPGERRLPVAWYEPGTIGYLSAFAREKTGWT